MATYTRKPKKAVAKCPVAGCKWIRIFFDWHQPKSIFTAHFTPELRAEMSLRQHQRMKHRDKVLINGR